MAAKTRTFVLVHGAWHGGWCWRRLADRLEARGHKIFAPTLTGLGERAHLMSGAIKLATHITDIVNIFKYERLSDVVLCGHSYAGFVISGVAEPMEKAISSIVFLDAFYPDNGQSCVEVNRPGVKEAVAALVQKGEIGIPPRSAEAFGVNEKDPAWVDALCGPQPIATFTDRITLTGARERIAKKTYVRAKGYDNPAFDLALARVKPDPSWRTYEVNSGHDVMVDQPERLTEILIEVA
ncbi:MAG TPA: alpha/beta hydrolase [Xanthobacteraceae bacterium]|nr:alpha/beta hydrolase [Xanthobacteraceae bacterium]